MPVNPLWLEHTEKAAWDTVQTLRQQIEAERARVERLTSMQENWPKMLQALAEAQTLHAVSAATPAEVVGELSAELQRVKSAQLELVEKLRAAESRRELRAPAAASEVCSDEHFGADFLEAFVALVQKRAERKPRRSFERLLDALETKLEDLEQAAQSDVGEHAVEIAYLAWRLAERSRTTSIADDTY
jgi:uncharacterized protein YPO0396